MQLKEEQISGKQGQIN